MRKLSRLWTLRWVRALSLPCLWVLLLGLELSLVMEYPLQNKLFRAFEDLVFIMSFLFYNLGGLEGHDKHPFLQFFMSFSLQFVFWWGVNYGFLYIKEKFNLKGGIRVKKRS